VRARDLAHRLAQRERRSVAEIVERALEACESASSFYSRLSTDFGADIDLDALIRKSRSVNPGLDW